MGDDKITDQPVDSKVEEESVNADDNNNSNSDSEQSFTDTVKALSNNSIKKIRKLNNYKISTKSN